ncbi:MAG: glycosyltransferase family 39 protein, partial [Anaerolineae bacterium]|nr:glycosyltransferase family 39 protein [Anaerolineae bacterium]
NGHPFWVISDGKIINHWLIAAFYPQNAPAFAGRIATVFVALLGLAAGMTVVRRLAGAGGAALAVALWLGSPYLFFYERLAFSDAQAGAWVVVAVALAWRFGQSGRWRDAVLSGLTFGAAALFKFTAAPFALSIALVILFTGQQAMNRRVRGLLLAGVVTAACFVVPLAYLLWKGDDFFSIALGWLGASSGGQPSLVANLERFWAQLSGFGTLAWVLLAGAGLLLLALRGRQWVLVGVGLLPLLLIMLLGREVLSRHFVVALPLLLTLAGAGLGVGLRRVRDARARQMVTAFGAAGLLLGVSPFMLTAYSDPAALPLPADARYEHITSHSSGYALREAVEAFPQTLARSDLPIIASMFPDSCRRANFYAASGLRMFCTDAPGMSAIDAALESQGAAYVLTDNAPNIGLDVTTLDARVTRIAAYPRPGEAADAASVLLWLVERGDVAGAVPVDCAADVTLPTYEPAMTSTFVTLRDGQFAVGDTTFTARGVNYYPLHYPWRRFLTQADVTEVARELVLLRTAGFNTLRLFLWNAALFACPERSAIPIPDAFARLDAIIREAAGQGFRLIITLNDLPDLTNAPLYDNPPHVQAQTRLIIERYRDEAAVLAWDVRNEGDIDYGSISASGAKFERGVVLDWLAQTAAFVRGLDSNHLITAGWLHDSGATAPYVDFVSFHHWEDAARMRERLAEIRAATDKPVLLQEFGFSTFRVSEDEQARLLSEVSAAAEAEGLLGWLIWTAFDFPLDATCTPPACPSTDNAEHHFGLWRTDYTPKPALEVVSVPGQ